MMLQTPYLVQGGFQSWVKQGLRVKELKPETAVTILNEVLLRLLLYICSSAMPNFAYLLYQKQRDESSVVWYIGAARWV